MEMLLEQSPAEAELLQKLTKDLKASSLLLSRDEARYLVRMYYQIQDYRVQAAGQVRADDESPNALLNFVLTNMRRLENNIKLALGVFADSYAVGHWLQSICGIGDVISAGLLAHLDVEGCPTAGHFWSFAGLDPRSRWISAKDALAAVKKMYPGEKSLTKEQAFLVARSLGKQWKGETRTIPAAQVAKILSKRPWSKELKTLVVYKAGECFVKFQNHRLDFYGHLFVERRESEWKRNMSGGLAYQCKAALGDEEEMVRCHEEGYSIVSKDYGDQTPTRAWMEGRLTRQQAEEFLLLENEQKLPFVTKCAKQPIDFGVRMLSPAHIHARARRWTTKMFLSHLHHAMHLDYYGKEPPVPYAMAKLPGDHRHYIPPPNLSELKGKSLRDLQTEKEP